MCLRVLGPVLRTFLFSPLGTKTRSTRVNSRNLNDDTPSACLDLGEYVEHQTRELQHVSDFWNCNDYFLVK